MECQGITDARLATGTKRSVDSTRHPVCNFSVKNTRLFWLHFFTQLFADMADDASAQVEANLTWM